MSKFTESDVEGTVTNCVAEPEKLFECTMETVA